MLRYRSQVKFNVTVYCSLPASRHGGFALYLALSSLSGAWIGLKLVTDICDGGGTVAVGADVPRIALPEGYHKIVDARLVPPITLTLEHEVNARRLKAAIEFARLNGLNQWRGP